MCVLCSVSILTYASPTERVQRDLRFVVARFTVDLLQFCPSYAAAADHAGPASVTGMRSALVGCLSDPEGGRSGSYHSVGGKSGSWIGKQTQMRAEEIAVMSAEQVRWCSPAGCVCDAVLRRTACRSRADARV